VANTVVRRTTMIVADADRSRRFYEDVLGFETYYDSQMAVTGQVIPIQPAGATVQLYIMAPRGHADAKQQNIGKVGILQWVDPELPPGRKPPARLGIGDVVFVADSDDIQGLYRRVSAQTDATVHCPPMNWSFPAPDGSGELKLTSMSFFDPDGYLHEVYYRHNRPNPEGYLIRRTTSIVRDMDQTIALYRDALGLEIHQDNEMNLGGGMEIPAGEPGARMRLTVFKGNHDYIGMIGALQFLDPPLPDPDWDTWSMGIGRVVNVGGHQDVEAIYPKIEQCGVRLTCPPLTRSVPASGGKAEIPMTTIGFFDPDGQLWEVNQR
jgi:catechol 2,3-dioxygenase-like lactoylglutathione lyase family enzyme